MENLKSWEEVKNLTHDISGITVADAKTKRFYNFNGVWYPKPDNRQEVFEPITTYVERVKVGSESDIQDIIRLVDENKECGYIKSKLYQDTVLIDCYSEKLLGDLIKAGHINEENLFLIKEFAPDGIEFYTLS